MKGQIVRPKAFLSLNKSRLRLLDCNQGKTVSLVIFQDAIVISQIHQATCYQFYSFCFTVCTVHQNLILSKSNFISLRLKRRALTKVYEITIVKVKVITFLLQLKVVNVKGLISNFLLRNQYFLNK